jgi:hypothetical protein
METLLMNCKSHLYKVIHNRLLESIITTHTQYNNIMNKQQIYSTIFKRLKVIYSPYVNKAFVYIFVSKILSFIRQLFIFS